MSYTTHLNPYYVAEGLDLADDPQSANIVRKVAAERDLAVAALRRIKDDDAGREYQLACNALDWIDFDPSDNPETCTSESIKLLIELDILGDYDEDGEDEED